MSSDKPTVLDRRRVDAPPFEWQAPDADTRPGALQPAVPAGRAEPHEVPEHKVPAHEAAAHEAAAHERARYTVGRTIARVLLLAVVVGWALLLRPQAIGGPVFYGRTLTTAMAPSIAKGAIVVAERQASYRVGDVIVYRDRGAGGSGTLIVGRVVGGDGTTGYVAKGDRSQRPDRFHPTSAEVFGRVLAHMSLLAFVAASVVAAAVVFLLVIAAWPRRLRR
jgi:signal peptidase I